MFICPLFSAGLENITACDWIAYTNLESQHFCLLWCRVYSDNDMRPQLCFDSLLVVCA